MVVLAVGERSLKIMWYHRYEVGTCVVPNLGVIPRGHVPFIDNCKGNLMLTKREALAELWDGDHAIFRADYAKTIAEPFGFDPHVRTYRDCRRKDGSTNDPKGVFLDSGPGTSMQGLGADDLACQVARHLGVTYESKYGRGSQLREALHQIAKHLEKEAGGQ